MKNNKLKVGVIGVGHLGEYHVQKYLAIPEVDLVGVVDANPDRATEIGRRYDTRVFPSLSGILDRVEAVSLAVPTETHFDVAIDILSKGIHVLIEKPITYRLEDADGLLKVAKEKNVVLQVGLVERFNPAVVRMQSLLNNPVFIESHRMNVFTTRGIDVDVVLDLMIHDLDIILHIVPAQVKEIHAVGMSVITGKTDVANARIIFDNGTQASFTASRVSDRTIRKIRVFQPDACLCVDCARREIDIIRMGREVKGADRFPSVVSNRTSFPDSDPLADEISSFVNVVNNGTSPVVTGRDGRRALEVALVIIDQIEKNRGKSKAVGFE